MKLLRLIPSLNPASGGPAQGIRQLSPLLSDRGVTTTVLSLDPPDSPWLSPSSSEGFGAIGLGNGLGIYGYRPGLPARLLPWLRDADAVVIHGLWQYHALAAWRSLQQLGRNAPPYWVYSHGMLDPWFRHRYPIKHLKKCLYWPWADYRVLRDAQAVLFTTRQEADLARNGFFPYRVHERVVPYGIVAPTGDPAADEAAFAAAFPQLNGRPFLLSLARLHVKKGLDILLEAFARISSERPELHLVLAGPDGGMRAPLERRTQALGLADRVHFPSLLLGPCKWGGLRRCELFCLPSHQENFGLAVVEALACGKPVLISTAVNLALEVQEAAAGLVQPDTLAATAEALRRWLDLPAPERQAMGLRARALFEQRFELSANADQLHRLFSGATTADSTSSRVPSSPAVC